MVTRAGRATAVRMYLRRSGKGFVDWVKERGAGGKVCAAVWEIASTFRLTAPPAEESTEGTGTAGLSSKGCG
ncbi:MAG: hypothetical protein WA045_14465, partial [Nitrospira sp.]